MSRKVLLFIALHGLGSLPSNSMIFFFLISLVLPTNLQEKNPRTKQNKLALSQIRDWLRRGAAYAETKERVLALCFWYTCDSVLKSSFLLPSVGSRWVADTYSEKKMAFWCFSWLYFVELQKEWWIQWLKFSG